MTMSMKQINVKIAGIRRSAKAIDANAQLVLVAAAEHASKHGDWSALQRLRDAFGRSMRVKALDYAIEKHTPLRVKDGRYFKVKKTDKPFDFKALEATPFYEMSTENTQALNLDSLGDIAKMIEQAEKRIAKAQAEGRQITGDVDAYRQRIEQARNFCNLSIN